MEDLLVAVGGLKANDQRLSKADDGDRDSSHYRSIRSGKTFATSTEEDDADVWD